MCVLALFAYFVRGSFGLALRSRALSKRGHFVGDAETHFLRAGSNRVLRARLFSPSSGSNVISSPSRPLYPFSLSPFLSRIRWTSRGHSAEQRELQSEVVSGPLVLLLVAR